MTLPEARKRALAAKAAVPIGVAASRGLSKAALLKPPPRRDGALGGDADRD